MTFNCEYAAYFTSNMLIDSERRKKTECLFQTLRFQIIDWLFLLFYYKMESSMFSSRADVEDIHTVGYIVA